MTQPYSTKANLSHEERTATEPRNAGLHPVILSEIAPVNEQIKTYKVLSKDAQGIKFLAGQWLDVFVPGVPKAGGFTITSPPQYASPSPSNPNHKPFLELAVQRSPSNPPAAWLWRPEKEIVGSELNVRVGGSFTYPPLDVPESDIEEVVFVAGGVGINPLISMIQAILLPQGPQDVPNSTKLARKSTPNLKLLYSTKLPTATSSPSEILSFTTLLPLLSPTFTLRLYITGTLDGTQLPADIDGSKEVLGGVAKRYDHIDVRTGRISSQDLKSAAAGLVKKPSSAVFYVCGPPGMTDWAVAEVKAIQGVVPERVYCEKWW